MKPLFEETPLSRKLTARIREKLETLSLCDMETQPVILRRSTNDIVENDAIQALHRQLPAFDPCSQTAFLEAYYRLTKARPQYRNEPVLIRFGKEVLHQPPPPEAVPERMAALFDYLRHSEDDPLVRSSVFHYHAVAIHPFSDGNGRIARYWQTLVLSRQWPVFEAFPAETLVSRVSEAYYAALSASDRAGTATIFTEWMLATIAQALPEPTDQLNA
jgi:Fic family protein